MKRLIFLAVSALTSVGLLTLPARSDGAATAATPPPQIYHIVTTALCARLHERVQPAVALILQNDTKIAKSPPLFKRYQRGTLTAQDPAAGDFSNGAPPQNDSMNNESPETSMALQQMSYLVLPIAKNLISAQTLLDSVKLIEPTGNPGDDATLKKIKDQLLDAIAYQSASLDIINGFVATQQMGELQHAGEEYLGSIQGTNTTYQMVQATPNPWQDPNTPGLSPNPYNFDVTTVPGLAVGYNPLNNIMTGLHWVIGETQKKEDAAGSTLTTAMSQCGK
ncbi:MAG TPA: hypothetical protein VHX17_10025 [Candidatus Cybelea sp.]|jgi:hypothetical protein|nr:hypothetical protein [Candidatus Cybelea sp.]